MAEPINTEVSALMLGFLSTTSNSFTSLVGCTFLLLSLSLCLRSLFYCLLTERPCGLSEHDQNSQWGHAQFLLADGNYISGANNGLGNLLPKLPPRDE
jgi:hypothetical protein